ncbi:hypothetical protein MMC29_000016 [Sticta canariensis]|nr:hypothetical protein [Sticta canariensis]
MGMQALRPRSTPSCPNWLQCCMHSAARCPCRHLQIPIGSFGVHIFKLAVLAKLRRAVRQAPAVLAACLCAGGGSCGGFADHVRLLQGHGLQPVLPSYRCASNSQEWEDEACSAMSIGMPADEGELSSAAALCAHSAMQHVHAASWSAEAIDTIMPHDAFDSPQQPVRAPGSLALGDGSSAMQPEAVQQAACSPAISHLHQPVTAQNKPGLTARLSCADEAATTPLGAQSTPADGAKLNAHQQPTPQSAPAPCSQPSHQRNTLLAWLSGSSARHLPKSARRQLSDTPSRAVRMRPAHGLPQACPAGDSAPEIQESRHMQTPAGTTLGVSLSCASAPAVMCRTRHAHIPSPFPGAASQQHLTGSRPDAEPAASQATDAVQMDSTACKSTQTAGSPHHHSRQVVQQARQPLHEQRRRMEVDQGDPQPAACGVRVVWTSVEARRQGVATQLLNAAR